MWTTNLGQKNMVKGTSKIGQRSIRLLDTEHHPLSAKPTSPPKQDKEQRAKGRNSKIGHNTFQQSTPCSIQFKPIDPQSCSPLTRHQLDCHFRPYYLGSL